MKSILFEIDRLKGNIVMKIVMLFILALSFLTIYFSSSNFKNNLKQKEDFIYFEETKIRMLNTYEQYGVTGIRLTQNISPLTVIFKNTSIFESLISTSDIIDIYNSRRGKNNYINQGIFSFMFSDILFLMSVVALYFGVTTFTGINPRILYRRWPQMISSALSRLLLFDIFVIALFALVYVEIILLGIKMTWNETGIILLFLLYTLTFYGIFFIIGVSINVGKWKSKITIMVSFWFIITILIPITETKIIEKQLNKNKSLDTLQIEKFIAMMNFERSVQKKYEEFMKQKNPDTKAFKKKILSFYLDTLFKSNLLREKLFMGEEEKILRWKERIAFIFPSTYFQYIAFEFSGTGDNCYLDFQRFILEKRTEFINFIIRKRHFENDPTVKEMCSPEKNILKTKIITPSTYTESIIFNLVILILIILIIVVQIKRTFPLEKDSQEIKNEPGFFFQYFETFNDLKTEQNRVSKSGCSILINDDNNLFMNSRDKIKLISMVKYFSYILNIQPDEIETNLKLLGIKSQIAFLSKREIKNIVAAILLAKDSYKFTVVDYIKGEDHIFDENMRLFFNTKINEGKEINYLTTQFPEVLFKKEKRRVTSLEILKKLDIINFSLR